MRGFVVAVILGLLGSPLFAVSPQFWKVGTADELLTGELEGMAVTSDGELRAAPRVEKIATVSDPFVLSQASDDAGNRYLGTGNSGKVYRLHGKELTLLWTAPEPEIYALAFSGGALYAGSSPNGKVYRIDPGTGKGLPFYDPKQAYIWAIQPSGGDLFVGTGVEGKLFRVDGSGKGEEWFDAPETHLRCLAAAGSGRIFAGGSGEGRIYEITGKDAGRALYDSALTEISAISIDPATGSGWAAGATSTLPTAPPQKPAQNQPKQASGQQPSSAPAKEGDASAAAPSVEITYSFDDAQGQAPQPAVNAELYRIDSDGFVEVSRKFEHEIIYAISAGPNGSVYLSTGPQGRVYQLQGSKLSLIATLPEKQVVSFSAGPSGVFATTTNSGAVYRIGTGLAPRAEFRSPVKDLQRFSRFGTWAVDGRELQGTNPAISFRTGNTDTPDTTWSGWSEAQHGNEGVVHAPAARYVQWKLDADNPSPAFAVDSVSIAYVNRNVAPVIEGLGVNDPGVVFISSNYPSAPQVVEATNPDENGIFTSLDNPTDNTMPGKKYFRRGYRTVAWKASDANGDSLRYTLSFRPKGGERWLRIREGIDDNQINFDTSQLPDGRYELRLVATDAPDNPESPLTDTKEGVEFLVDNTAPSITWSVDGGDFVIKVTDALSPISKMEYSVDADKWVRLLPVDGIADSPSETYRLRRSDLVQKFVVVRAVDSFFNVATASIGK